MKDVMYYLTFGRRYLVIGALALIGGTYTALNQNIKTENAAGIYVFAASFVFALVFALAVSAIIFRRQRKICRRMFCVFLFAVIFICGHILAVRRIARFDADMTDLEERAEFVCCVISEPEISSSGKSYGFQCEVLKSVKDSEEKTYERRPKILVYLGAEESPPEIGDIISVRMTMPISGRKSGFDYEGYLRQNNICLSCIADNANTADYGGTENDLLRLKFAGRVIRREILKSSDAYPYNTEELSLLQGILIGNTENFSEEHYDRLANSGFMHIAAVSGLHISYLVMFLSAIFGMLKFPKRLYALLVSVCLILFASAAGFTPSVCRAVVMMLIFLAASLIMRPYDGICALAAAAISLLIYNPYFLTSTGFILSFGATLGILVFYNPMYKAISSLLPKTGKRHYISPIRSTAANAVRYLTKFILSSVCVSLSATVGLLYPMMKIFGNIQWGSIIGNIAAIPLTAVVFVGGMATSVIYRLVPSAAYFTAAYFVNPSLRILNKLAEVFSNSIFRITVAAPPKSFFLVYIVLCIGLYLLLIPCEEEGSNETKAPHG